MFLASVSFFAAFAAARGVTHAIRHHIGPFHNFGTRGGTHIHHAVFGISGLLAIGYLWNAQLGVGKHSPGASRATALAYGAAAALTLDEFALWLNLKDVYWKRQGRQSIDAVVLFGGALSIAGWGGRFLRDAAVEVTKVGAILDRA